MKKLFLSLGTLILCTVSPSFATSNLISPAIPSVSTKVIQQSNTSSSTIINPEFDEYVRKRPYVKYLYRNDAHARLLGLARRYLTLMELDQAITQILNSRR